MNIAVVDDGGHLIAFERMEGARPASVYTAHDQGDDRRDDATAQRAVPARARRSRIPC